MDSRITVDSPLPNQQKVLQKGMKQGRIASIPEEGRCLNSAQLDQVEQSFRKWSEVSPRADVRLARRRILIIFLLIRYTGAKLNEVLTLNPFKDIDFKGHSVDFSSEGPDTKNDPRRVQISTMLSSEIQEILTDPFFKSSLKNRFDVDPGFVRRKFYERAEACGFPKSLGGPEMIRKSRAVELMQGNMPLPAVQKMLGHSTLNPTGSYVSFSVDDIQRVTKLFIERESSRKTSARNSFFGKIQALHRGDIQTRVTLISISGYSVTTVITNDSAEQLALKKGMLITAEVKAPWVILHSGKEEPKCSAENRFNGIIERMNKGKINTEYTVRITDGTELCAVVSTEGVQHLGLKTGDQVWAIFNCFAVVLDVD
ncbi:TOBE domain-containing protein [Desulfobacula sp.]|uniref:TOBE domain-containing protein n=1 Tax=Desulfobacula sp. TaxID=2593537 RepID=UPI00261592C6|nr:TOBE domain-containing protein [Desulfobacula sp.]